MLTPQSDAHMSDETCGLRKVFWSSQHTFKLAFVNLSFLRALDENLFRLFAFLNLQTSANFMLFLKYAASSAAV